MLSVNKFEAHPHICRWCDTTRTPIPLPPYPAKHPFHSTEGRSTLSDLSLAAGPARQYHPAAAAVPVWHGLSIQRARQGYKIDFYLLPKLPMPSPLRTDGPFLCLQIPSQSRCINTNPQPDGCLVHRKTRTCKPLSLFHTEIEFSEVQHIMFPVLSGLHSNDHWCEARS